MALPPFRAGCYAGHVIRGPCCTGGNRMRAQRRPPGCVRFDKRRGTWNYLFYDHGKRRSKLIGTKQQYPTKASAWKAVKVVPKKTNGDTVSNIIARYESERMPV